METLRTTKALRCTLFSALLLAFALSAVAQSTAFTYQGRLNDGNGVANGLYDLQFALFDAATAGTQQGSTISSNAVPISNGLFTVTLDFGDQFSGANRWLEIGVTTNGGGSFTKLAPRQMLTTTPYAMRAVNATTAINATTAASANSVAATNITGAISLTQLPVGVVTNGASNVSFTGTFSGNGSGLTGLNAANIATGVISPARLPSMVSSVTNLLGLAVDNISFAVGPTMYVPATSFVSPTAVIQADVNGDGWQDIITANFAGGTGNTLSVFTNNRIGGFVASGLLNVGNGPYSVTSADVNNDGKADLISANANSGSITVLTNNGTGVFSIASSPTVVGPNAVTMVDINADGRVDAVVANYSGGSGTTLTILTNDGTGIFSVKSTATVGKGPISVTSADLNGDGKPDLISANKGTNTLSVLTNNGNGTFSLASSLTVGNTPQSVVSADVNGDGFPDVISANFSGTVSVFTNDGTGSFALATTLSNPQATSVVATDVGVDNKVDLIVSSDNLVRVYTNSGAGTFSLLTAVTTPVLVGQIYVAAGDMNRDGRVDLIAANSYSNSVTVLFNTGALTVKGNGAGLTNLNVANLAGTLSFAQLPAGIVTNGATNITGTFVGNAAGLTNLNVTNLSGTISFAQLPTGVITNGATNISGTFAGNGSGLTNLDAASLASGTLNPSRIPNLDASKITTGNLSDGLLSTNVALRSGGNLFLGQQEVKDSVISQQQVLDQEQTTYTAYGNGGDLWQSFTAGTNGYLTAVGLTAAAYIGYTNQPGTIRIYDGEGINGALLATQPVIWPEFSSGGALFTYPLSHPPTVLAGHQYTIRFDPQASIAYSNENPYPGGTSSLLTPNTDFLFQTYVTVFQNDTILMVSSAGYTPRVGIGTNAPQATLHVVGDILADHIVATNTTATNYFESVVAAHQFAGPIDSPYLKFAEITGGTTQGGTAVAGTNNWRNFNVKQRDTYNLGSTNGAGGIVLPAGTYQCRISAPGYEVSSHQIRLVTTNGTQLLYGTIAYSGSGAYGNNRSEIADQFTLANTTTLRVQHWCEAGNSGNGLGAFSGGTIIWGDTTNINIFATAEFWKIK